MSEIEDNLDEALDDILSDECSDECSDEYDDDDAGDPQNLQNSNATNANGYYSTSFGTGYTTATSGYIYTPPQTSYYNPLSRLKDNVLDIEKMAELPTSQQEIVLMFMKNLHNSVGDVAEFYINTLEAFGSITSKKSAARRRKIKSALES